MGWAYGAADLAIISALAAMKALPPPQPGDKFVIDKDPFQGMLWADCFHFRLYYLRPEIDMGSRDQVTAEERSVGRWRNLSWENNSWKELSKAQ